MPPVPASQHKVYCARPGPIRPRSLVSVAFTNAAAPGPRTVALPRWLTSKMPTASRTAVCSLTTPEPAYSKGIDHPPNSASLAPRDTCRSCRGDVRSERAAVAELSEEALMRANLPQTGRPIAPARVRHCSLGRHRGVGELTSYTLRRGAAEKTKADVVVIGVVQTPKGLAAAPGGEGVASAYGRKFAPLLSTIGFKARAGDVAKVPTGGVVKSPLLVLVGMGPADGVDAAAVRRAAGVALRTVSNAASVALALPALDEQQVRAAVEGAILGGYSYTTYKSDPGSAGPGEVVVLTDTA